MDGKAREQMQRIEEKVNYLLGPGQSPVTQQPENDIVKSATLTLTANTKFQIDFVKELSGRAPRFLFIQPSVDMTDLQYKDITGKDHDFTRGLSADEPMTVEYPDRWTQIFGIASNSGSLYWYATASSRETRPGYRE